MARFREISSSKYNIVVMGDPYCGKSSIIERYTTGKYGPSYIQTIGSEYSKKELDVADRHIHLFIFDTAGQQDMKTIIRSIYRNAQGIVLVFDFTRKKTLEHIHGWIDLIKMNCDILPELILLGNKYDMSGHQVTTLEAELVARSHDISFCEVSAKRNHNIDEAFTKLAKQLYSNRKRLYPDVLISSIRLHETKPENFQCCSDH